MSPILVLDPARTDQFEPGPNPLECGTFQCRSTELSAKARSSIGAYWVTLDDVVGASASVSRSD